MAISAGGALLQRPSMLWHEMQRHAHLPQLNDLLERDVGLVVAAPLAAVLMAVAAVAQQVRVCVGVVVAVQEPLDALENFAGLQRGLSRNQRMRVFGSSERWAAARDTVPTSGQRSGCSEQHFASALTHIKHAPNASIGV